MDWASDHVTLGRSGLRVRPLGLGSSFGLSAADVERAFERGLNFFYWGSLRRGGFGRGLRSLASAHRDDLVIVVQSYTRVAALMKPSLVSALRRLRIDYADLLLLGWWNAPPPARIIDTARELCAAGLARKVMVSCHHRPSFQLFAADPAYDVIMVRYNAAHPGAEHEVFPHLGAEPPGVVCYTATRWGALLDPRWTPAGEPTPTATDCYRFALTHPSVDLCLAGPANGDQLDAALAALTHPMDEDELAWMRRVGAAVHDRAGTDLRSRVMGVFDRLGKSKGVSGAG